MDFSVRHSWIAEDREKSDIVSADFQYTAERWHKQGRRKNVARRVAHNVEKEPDQQNLPPPSRKKTIIRKQEEYIPEEPIVPEESPEVVVDDGPEYDRFSQANGRSFALIKLDRSQSQKQQSRPASQVGVAAQAMKPQAGIPAQQPRMYYPHQAIQKQPMPQQPQQPDESNCQLKCEGFFIKSKEQRHEQQQERQRGDNSYLGTPVQQQLRPGMPYGYAGTMAAQYQQRMLAATQIGRVGMYPYAYTQQVQMQQLQATRMMSRPTSPYQQPQQPPPVVKEYINKDLCKCKWGLIDPDDPPPLTFDKSDTRIKYTEVSEQRSGEKKAVRQWNDMNLENTNFHTALYVSRDSRLSLDIQHSWPALNMTLIEPHLTEEDFMNYHHPKSDTKKFIKYGEINVTLKPDIQSESEGHVSPFLKDLKSLSGKKGGVVIVEHTLESLVYILNVGMASKLITYYHKATSTDFPKTVAGNVDNLHILEPDQKSPFSAEIPRSELVPSINCHLYSIPLAEHDVPDTDFLLIKSTKKMKFYIRRFNSIYCGGYLEPRQIVLRPATKTAQEFHMSFIKAVLINVFRGTEQHPGRKRIQVSQIQQKFFPGVNDPKIRNVLHSFAKFYREQGNGFWERKDDVDLDDAFQKIQITPEMVCRYQSMLVGQWKLRQNGVNILTKSKRVFQQIQNLRGEYTERVAKKIEIELMKTPWARTDNFSKAFQGHAVQIEHTDDGAQIVRSKSRRGKLKTADGKDQPAQTKRPLAGTRSDLRKLTLSELRENLIALGATTTEIDGLDRWAQVDLLRQLCNRQKQDGTESDLIRNFSRGPRNDYAASLDEYKEQYQRTFDNNLHFIKTKGPTGEDDDDDLDDGNILDELSLKMMRNDREDDNEDLDDMADEEKAEHFVGKDDPPELVPYGVCVCRSKINWDELGYAGIPRRKVAKLITISWTRTEGLHVELHWIRSPLEIANMMKYPAVYADQGQKAHASNEDLEEYLDKTKRKGILDKLRRTRQAVKSKGAKAQVQSYIAVQHQMRWVSDTGGNNLTFRLTPELIAKIEDVSERFAAFEKRTGRSHGKKKKTSSVITEHASDDDSDDTVEVVRAPKKRIGRQNPVVLFNELLKKLLMKLIQRPGDEFWPFKKPVLKKDFPDYYNVVYNPMCFEDIERKANNMEYTTILKFYQDVKLIESNCRDYNTNRNPDLVALGEKMVREFEIELRNVREDLDQKEAEIDPVLRSQE